jgi:hypothetical protein
MRAARAACRPRRRACGGAALAAFLAITFAGCAARDTARTPTPPDKLPTVFEVDSLLSERRNAVRGMRALARLHYRHPEGNDSSREAIVVGRPDRLRVEVLSLFGAVFVLTANEGEFTAYARQENTVYRGTASPENMWRYARIGLPVVDLVDLVLGTPPQRTETWSHVSYDEESGWIQLSQELKSGIQAVWIEANLPRAAEFRDEFGDVQWRAYFEDYREEAGIPIAMRIRLEVPDADHSVEIALEDVDINPALADDLFRIAEPPGSRTVVLD